MTRVELKSAAKEQIKGNIGKLLLVMIIIFAIGLVCGFIPFVGSIIAFIITPALSLGVYKIYLKLTKKEEMTIGDMFSGFNQTGRALWLNILIAVFTWLWSLLFVIPGIVKSFAYSMAYLVLADNPEFTAREALNKSKEIMNGHKWDLFVLCLSFFWWYLLVGITFGLAGIYVVPYVNATIANFYNSIKGSEKASEVEPITETEPVTEA